MRRMIAIAGASLVIITGLTLTTASAASAATPTTKTAQTTAGNQCEAWIEEKVWWPLPEQYRVAIRCTSIDASFKIRGTATFPAQPDEHTEWFTETNHTYYSTFRNPWIAKPKARVDIEPR